MKECRAILFIVTCIFIMGCATGDSNKTPSQERSESIEPQAITTKTQGQKIYDIYCLICHGKDGKRALTGYYDLAESTLDLKDIKDVVQKGRNAMTPYEAILDEEELEALSKYVLTFQNN